MDNVGNRIAVGSVAWESSQSAVASIDAAGRISALSPGATSISATAGSVSASAPFTVTALAVPPISVRVAPPYATIAFGDSLQLSAATLKANGDTVYSGPYTWESSTPAVATASPGGLVKAISPGVAVVRATANGLSGSVAVTVNAFVDTSMHVNVAAPQPGEQVGDTLQIILTVTVASQIARIAKVVASIDRDNIQLDTMPLGAMGSVKGWGKHIAIVNYPIGLHQLVITAYAFSQATSADTLFFDREVEQTGGLVPGGGKKQLKPAAAPRLGPPTAPKAAPESAVRAASKKPGGA